MTSRNLHEHSAEVELVPSKARLSQEELNSRFRNESETTLTAKHSEWERDDNLPIPFGKRLQNQQENFRYTNSKFYGHYKSVEDYCFGNSKKDNQHRDHLEIGITEWDGFWNASASDQTLQVFQQIAEEDDLIRSWKSGKGGHKLTATIALSVIDGRSNEELFKSDQFSEQFAEVFGDERTTLGKIKRTFFEKRGDFL